MLISFISGSASVVVTIGFEETMYFADEINGFVMVCAEVKPGSTLETQVVVNFNTADGSAIGEFQHTT